MQAWIHSSYSTAVSIIQNNIMLFILQIVGIFGYFRNKQKENGANCQIVSCGFWILHRYLTFYVTIFGLDFFYFTLRSRAGFKPISRTGQCNPRGRGLITKSPRNLVTTVTNQSLKYLEKYLLSHFKARRIN